MKMDIEGIIVGFIVLAMGIAFIVVGVAANQGDAFLAIMSVCGTIFIMNALQFLVKKFRCCH